MPEAESGMNMARIAALRAGLPDSVPGVTINRFCSSGLQAIAMAADRIRSGGAQIIIAGGAESMSLIPMAGNKFAPNPWMVDHMPQIYMGMGLTAEEVQRKYDVTREDSDQFAYRSHQNALRAQAEGKFDDEIVPVEVESTVLDNGTPRRHTALFQKGRRPARRHLRRSAGQTQAGLPREGGTVTAGNSSQTSDGAAAALVMSEKKAKELGLKPMARFVSFAVAGVPPEIMGIGPVVAIPKALALAGLKLDDIGVIELNEAFAVQALAVIRKAGLDLDRVNVNGGAIALGHPLGCTGAKLTATILREMRRAQFPLRNGDHVRRRWPGRRRHLRKPGKERFHMATSTTLPRETQRRLIPDRTHLARGTVLARGLHRRAPRHRPHHRGVLDQGNRAAPRSHPAPGAGRRGLDPAQGRRTRPHRRRDSGKIRRHGDGPHLRHDRRRGHRQGRLLRRLARRASGHRHSAAAVVRHRGTEAALSSQARQRRDDRRLRLSEPQAGSDALAARTRADLSPDGKHYILNGQKMWITNGGAADLFTVFAKVDGEKFTAFLVERRFPGVSAGAEEKKMGIKGSSTTAIYLDNVPVPVENVLGEIGRGHIIAFNILNIGRLKLGPVRRAAAPRKCCACSLKYAKERKAFGKSIAEFGMIQHKLAEMAIRIFATESAAYRVVGLIESQLQDFSWSQPDAAQKELKAVEEFAAECSFIKVFASEMLDYVVDEGVQIHGGYGFHQDYPVERAYRDSRINRIFEGTNEINRLLATGMLLKRAQRGQLPLVEAVKKLQAEILSGPRAGGAAWSRTPRKTALFALGVAYQKYGAALEEQQEVLASITDIAMNAFVMESVELRAQKLAHLRKGEIAADAAEVFLREAMETVESAARNVLAACSEGDTLRTNLAVLKRFTKFEPVNAIAARRRIAERLLAAEHYLV